MLKNADGFDEDDFVTPLEGTPVDGSEAEESLDEDDKELAAQLEELELLEAEEQELAEAVAASEV